MQNTRATETINPTITQYIDVLPATEMSNENDLSDPIGQRPWYKSEAMHKLPSSFMLMLLLTTGAYTLVELITVPTRIILKREGCAYLRHQQIATQSYDDATGMCIVTGPFQRNLIGSGGVFVLQDRKLEITEGQLVAIEKIDNVPYNDSQKRMILWMCINTVLLLVAMVWSIIRFV